MFVCANKTDKADPQRIIEFDDQTILVTRNIEYHPVTTENTCVAELSLHRMGTAPICIFGNGVPGLQWFLTVSILRIYPKIPDRFSGNDPQISSFEPL